MGITPPVIVIVDGIVLVRTFVLPSPSAPTNVSVANLTEIGEVVAANALNFIVAASPIPVIGVVVFAAPNAMDAVPLPTTPDEIMFGNMVPLWIHSASSLVGSNETLTCTATT